MCLLLLQGTNCLLAHEMAKNGTIVTEISHLKSENKLLVGINSRLKSKNQRLVTENSHLKSKNQRLLEMVDKFKQQQPIGFQNKQRSFMFAYNGQYIQRGVMADTIQYVENGDIGGGDSHVKYCVIKLHADKTRRESSLKYIINEYNAAVGFEGLISLVAMPMVTAQFFPTIMSTIQWAGNPVELKRNMDKMTMAPSFSSFTNKKTAEEET